MASKDKDYRLISLVSDVCPLPLRKMFSTYAQSDTNFKQHFTLNNYMTFCQPDVKKLQPKFIRKDQYNLIYPNADDTQWDVTLLSALLKGLFQSRMLNGEDPLIRIIRDTRNKLQHKPGTVVTSDVEFDTIWNDIETSTLKLAQIVGGTTYEDEIKQLINGIKTSNLPRLGDTLKNWYEDIIVQLRNEIDDLKVTSNKSLGILEATTVKRKAPLGGKSKRQKMDDPYLNKLRGHFEHTMMRELPCDFVPDEKAKLIKRKLEKKHYVVVTGHENTNYLATVLSAVNDLHYRTRCVEIKNVDDWNHVDCEETDLVLYCEPFQDHEANKNTTFQSMYDSATMSEQNERVDVVIVSEHAMVMAWKERNDIPLFEDVVELNRPTEENNPLDVEKRHHFRKKSVPRDVLENMIAYSDAYISQYRNDTYDHPQMETAKAKFKEHKAIVITGPKGSGITNFAVNLVSSLYEKKQCVVLTETSEWKHVILGDVSVVIIDDFAGKYKYNASMVEGWLQKFDLIDATIKQGKLNLIVTCERTIYAKFLTAFGGHALLMNRVNLQSQGFGKVVVKDEPMSPVSEDQNISNIDEGDASNVSRELVEREAPVQHTDENLPVFKSVVDVNLDVKVIDICEMQDGTLLCIYSRGINEGWGTNYTYFISKFDMKDLTFTHTAELPSVSLNTTTPLSVSSVGLEFIVFYDEHNIKRYYGATIVRNKIMRHGYTEESGIRLGIVEKIGAVSDCKKIIWVDGKNYVVCTKESVSIYDQAWNYTNEIAFESDGILPLFYANTHGSRSEASKSITDITAGEDKIFISSKEKVVILNLDGDILNTFEADAEQLFVYNEFVLLIRSGNKISVYSMTGEFKRILLTLDEDYASIYQRAFLFFDKKNKMLFKQSNRGKKIYFLESSG